MVHVLFATCIYVRILVSKTISISEDAVLFNSNTMSGTNGVRTAYHSSST
jgi:hypothetical protein